MVVNVAHLRTDHLNRFLGITADADTIPWSVTDRNEFITAALDQSWPDIGRPVTDVAALNGSSDVYTIPATLQGGRISRIELESVGATVARTDLITNWRYYDDTHVRIRPLLASDASMQLRFFGFMPFVDDATAIPVRLETVIAMRAASLAYGTLASQLVNYKRQQGLDNARVVDYQTAVGLSAYWERRYFEQISKDPSAPSYAPRRARR